MRTHQFSYSQNSETQKNDTIRAENGDDTSPKMEAKVVAVTETAARATAADQVRQDEIAVREEIIIPESTNKAYATAMGGSGQDNVIPPGAATPGGLSHDAGDISHHAGGILGSAMTPAGAIHHSGDIHDAATPPGGTIHAGGATATPGGTIHNAGYVSPNAATPGGTTHGAGEIRHHDDATAGGLSHDAGGDSTSGGEHHPCMMQAVLASHMLLPLQEVLSVMQEVLDTMQLLSSIPLIGSWKWCNLVKRILR